MTDPVPTAWLHTMHYEEGNGCNPRLSFDEAHPFGLPDRDYSAEYEITSEPLYRTPPAVTIADHLNAAVNAEDLRNAYRYTWLRRRIAGTIIHRIDPAIEDIRPERLDELIDSRSGPCPSLTPARLDAEARASEEPMESIERCLSVSARDWSLHPRDAWIYGIVCGWPPAAMRDLARTHQWSTEDVKRLKRLRAAWQTNRALIRSAKP